MSLKAKLTRLERQVEWLQTEGAYRRGKAMVELLERKEQFAAHLARNPDDEVVRQLAWAMGLPLPPLTRKPAEPLPVASDRPPEPSLPAPVATSSPSPEAREAPHPGTVEASLPPPEALEGCAAGAVRVATLRESQGEGRGLGLPGVTLAPPPIEFTPSPPEPSLPVETHDIPEEMQVRPITWRVRGPHDEDDWDTGGHDPYRCLTEYDPLEEADF